MEVDPTRIVGISVGAAQTTLTEVRMNPGASRSEKHFFDSLCLSLRTAISGGKALPRKNANGAAANRIAVVPHVGFVSVQRSHNTLGTAFRRTTRR